MCSKKNCFALIFLITCIFVAVSSLAVQGVEQNEEVQGLNHLYDLEGNPIDMASTATISYYYSLGNVKIKHAKRKHKKEMLLSKFKSLDEALSYESEKGNAVWYHIPEYWYSEFKAYEPYTAITDTTAPQFNFLYGQDAWTDINGIRCNKNRYCIAVGSGFGTTEIGTKIDVILMNGNIIHCVLGDIKQDIHTQANNMQCVSNGSIIEFIVDYSTFSYVKDSSGTVNFVDDLDGKIRNIVVLGQ